MVICVPFGEVVGILVLVALAGRTLRWDERSASLVERLLPLVEWVTHHAPAIAEATETPTGNTP
jgi:hypothetical protein